MKRLMDLKIKTIKAGDCRNYPKQGYLARLHYEVWKNKMSDENLMDSTVRRKMPFEVILKEGCLLGNLEEQVLKMSLGQKVQIEYKPDNDFAHFLVDENTVLIIELELLTFFTPDEM